MTDIDEFLPPKGLADRLDDREGLMAELAEGKTVQEVLGFSEMTMDKFYLAARNLYLDDHYDDAANAFYFLTTVNPGVHSSWVGLGMAWQHSSNHEEALRAWEAAIETDPTDSIPYLNIVNCLLAMDSRAEALTFLDAKLAKMEGDEEFAELKAKLTQVRYFVDTE